MARNGTIDLLLDMARQRLDEAAAALAQAQGQRRQAEQQLNLLRQYQAEYQNRRNTLGTTHILELGNFTTFLGNLDAATTQQGQRVEQADATIALRRTQWEEARRHLKSIEVLAERRAAAERASAERQDRKHHDELAARLAARSEPPVG